jgi:hypothetical protein
MQQNSFTSRIRSQIFRSGLCSTRRLGQTVSFQRDISSFLKVISLNINLFCVKKVSLRNVFIQKWDIGSRNIPGQLLTIIINGFPPPITHCMDKSVYFLRSTATSYLNHMASMLIVNVINVFVSSIN